MNHPEPTTVHRPAAGGPRVLLAPDKFKGSLTAATVCSALARGIADSAPQARITPCPIADGGDGTVDAALTTGHVERTTTVTGPTGDPHDARWALREDGTAAVLELAGAVGLQALPRGELAPYSSSTRGLGELILAAVASGARTVVVGLGGSASTDLGAGMLQGLGARLRTADGDELTPGLDPLGSLRTADLAPALEALDGVRLIAATDVTNPLTGPDGAAAVYGPQKGLTAQDVPRADDLLARAARILDPTGTHADAPGSGAAGGTGFTLRLLGAEVVSGADAVLDLVGFEAALQHADLVITGEGKLDAQTLQGKGPAEVARRARSQGTPVLAVAGMIDLDAELLREAGIDRTWALLDRAEDPAEAMAHAAELLEDIGREIGAGPLP